MSRLVVLISGNGSNLQAIVDACSSGCIIGSKVVHVFSNKPGVHGLIRAAQANIPTTVQMWNSKQETRELYDSRLAALVQKQAPTLIILAGWMHLLSDAFLSKFKPNQIINLHPALPGQFPGKNAIEQAFMSETAITGAMCHYVTSGLDCGEVITQIEVPIYTADTLETLTARVQTIEKVVLLLGVLKAIEILNDDAASPQPFPELEELERVVEEIQTDSDRITKELVKTGKVRDVYEIDRGKDSAMMMVATDRFSCFDRNVCKIPQKGNVLNKLSAWWFEKTKHLVPNHLISVEPDSPIMFVKSCVVYPIEFVVRGFITGNTNTSMWTLYTKGERSFGPSGEIVPDGLFKNERLPYLFVTPTTKSDEHDEPINSMEDVERFMDRESYQKCHDYALDLFEYGQAVALERGLLLVDTKYEFGFDKTTGQIMVVDEMHTCDSSRFWEAESYQRLFDEDMEPVRFDKDIIRNWIRDRCNPYAKDLDGTPMCLPRVPDDLIANVSAKYIQFYETLTGNEYKPGFPTNVVIEAAAIAKFFNNRDEDVWKDMDNQRRAYLSEREELLQLYSGRWAAYANCRLLGTFGSHQIALKETSSIATAVFITEIN